MSGWVSIVFSMLLFRVLARRLSLAVTVAVCASRTLGSVDTTGMQVARTGKFFCQCRVAQRLMLQRANGAFFPLIVSCSMSVSGCATSRPSSESRYSRTRHGGNYQCYGERRIHCMYMPKCQSGHWLTAQVNQTTIHIRAQSGCDDACCVLCDDDH